MEVEKWSSNTSEGEIQFTTNYLQGCYFPKNELQFRLFETYFLSGSSFLCRSSFLRMVLSLLLLWYIFILGTPPSILFVIVVQKKGTAILLVMVRKVMKPSRRMGFLLVIVYQSFFLELTGGERLSVINFLV